MIVFANGMLLVTLIHLRCFKCLRCVLLLIPLVVIKVKGKMTTLVIIDLGITYYFLKIYILRVNDESSA